MVNTQAFDGVRIRLLINRRAQAKACDKGRSLNLAPRA
ncbi:hypothetical protein DEU51_10391 [Pseudomonas jessenii]|uniref:Uncharacterized protein n=1 Tax=Pseudomonas jessenii TaxID=77298 RepID=A0A370STA1_PSEJE|nr:hypothetical protein DEU51_10391 [Pseudomonas jessenii]CEL27704.1 hypothetical protein SRM1_01034 [Pseudomonas fluorescens]